MTSHRPILFFLLFCTIANGYSSDPYNNVIYVHPHPNGPIAPPNLHPVQLQPNSVPVHGNGRPYIPEQGSSINRVPAANGYHENPDFPHSAPQSNNNNNPQNYDPNGQSYFQVVGYPEGCAESYHPDEKFSRCLFMAKLIRSKSKPNYVTFELSGKTNGYIAVGLSKDLEMGNDHIIECVKKVTNSRYEQFEHYQSFSVGRLRPTRIKDDTSVVNNFRYNYTNGVLTCSFDRYHRTKVHFEGTDRYYDLNEGSDHLILAIGDLKDSTTDEIGYHGKEQRYVSRLSIGELRKMPYNERKQHYYYSTSSKNFSSHCALLLTSLVIVASFLTINQ